MVAINYSENIMNQEQAKDTADQAQSAAQQNAGKGSDKEGQKQQDQQSKQQEGAGQQLAGQGADKDKSQQQK